ncbi:hypothetical protein FK220_017515 [Flavobacteriaceae bacterium TP-CH-4]|uniref:Lipocalin-like domain-containing protein n=1 Tax=Pelagihabitans pacificus TaxID=2696054 RepID=A0A967E804_9FLAO|nr:hypothetical protein [Pelagihabitans pacificus]NHF61155.1 hypothetical protein [Pelagihabitans pacificus]
MRKFHYIGLFFVVVACVDTISEGILTRLNGYWEIEKVVFPDGNSKEYKSSTTVDYIQLENLKGFRKKVQPKFDGTYDTSNDAELFTIAEQEGKFHIVYKNEMSEWRERLVRLEENAFSVINEQGIRYDYKRFEPIKVDN